MRHAVARALLSLSAALLLWAPGLREAIAEPEAGGPTLSLSKDDRLRKPLALHERFITVAEALVKISRATGVRLRARSPQIGNENVILLVRQRPASEVLELLAGALDYRWSSIGGEQPKAGYELSQDEAGRRRE